MDKRKNNIKNISAIFLLAGLGKRIINLTKNPKCLLKINNQTIIDRNLTFLKELKIKNVTLVLGFKKDLIKKEIIKHKKFFNFNFVYNDNFIKHGNSYSLLKGLKFTKMQSLVFDGDLVYSKKILENFLIKGHRTSFLIGKTTIKNIECAKALADKNGFIKKTIDKRLIKKSELKKYKFVGEAIQNRKNLILNWEHFMNDFLVSNPIKYNNTLNSQWIEIDTKQDYVRAISLFKNK